MIISLTVEFQDKTIILFILTDKSKTREKYSKI